MRKWVSLIFLLGLSGCADAILVIHQDVTKPTFTVIPSAYNDKEIGFAGEIERSIVLNGLRVYERPQFIFADTGTTETKSSENGVAVGGNNWAVGSSERRSLTSPVEVTDVVAMYSHSKADYIAVTYYKDRRVRIVKKDDGSIVATLEATDNLDLPDQIHRTLTAGGFITQ